MPTLVLAHPPIAMPTSPPLGICALKGYLKRALPEWIVKVEDLNLATWLLMERRLEEGKLIDKGTFPEGALADMALGLAFDAFRGRRVHDFFHRGDRYTVLAEYFWRLLERETRNAVRMREAYYDRSPMPSVVYGMANQIRKNSPDIVGLSLNYEHQRWVGLCIAKELKRLSPGLPIVFGGSMFSIDQTSVLREHSAVVDYIISGEGEQALKKLLSQQDPHTIEGLSFMHDGEVIALAPSPIEDLDSLGVPDFSDLSLSSYFSPEPVLPIVTSRGCY
jgi:anaerobic magnesium-protoporphyrin IX monomethyl ester cyclase